MADLIRYAPSFRGVKALRATREIDEMLERRATRVAVAAEVAYGDIGGWVQVDVVQQGSDTKAPRARVAVIARTPDALKLEVQHRVLGGALDAARG